MAEFARVFKIQGMDGRATPRFQMVPANGKRFVILRDGVGMTLAASDPANCNFTEILESALPSGDRAPRQRGDRFFRLEASGTVTAPNIVACGLACLFSVTGARSLVIPSAAPFKNKAF